MKLLRDTASRFSSLATGILISGSALLGGLACDGNKPSTEETEKRSPRTGLTETEAKEVLAEVGDRKITLGDYAETLLRMGQFERARYQSPERQKELLEEMIDLELLAQEARRRGLDRKPENELRLVQALRDERLEELRRSLPPEASLPMAEVQQYYESHLAEFEEPERRRALVIVTAGKKAAEEACQKAQDASGTVWGELARNYSLDRRGLEANDALEWAGDLGFVSAPAEKRGDNAEVPAKVREELFRLAKVGGVSAAPVEVGGKYYVVRWGGTSPARKRSLKDAERTIRVELQRQKFLAAERALEGELRKKYPILIDEKALAAALAEIEKTPNKPAP